MTCLQMGGLPRMTGYRGELNREAIALKTRVVGTEWYF